MDYPEPLATLGTSDTGRRQTKHNTGKLLCNNRWISQFEGYIALLILQVGICRISVFYQNYKNIH
jgi:hypothetical protein